MLKKNMRGQETWGALPMGSSVEVARSISNMISIVIIVAGCAVLVGWAFDGSSLKSFFPNLVTMKANTAFCFILIGVAIWCLQKKRIDNRLLRLIAAASISLSLVIGLATLCEYVYHWDFGIDQLLFKEFGPLFLTSLPGRMAFFTASNFVLISLALIFISQRKTKLIYLIQGLLLVVGFISFLSMIANAFGSIPFFLGGRFSPIVAWHITTLFILTSVGILYLQPDRGLMAHVHCDLTGGRVLRRLLPIAFVVPIIAGFLKILSERTHLLGSEFGISLVTIINISVITIYVYFLSVLLNRAEAKRKVLEDSTAQTKDYLDKIINAVADPIFVKDREHRWVLVNTSFSNLMGSPPEALHGKSDYEFFPKEQSDIYWKIDEEILVSGREVANEETFNDDKGLKKVISTKKTLYTDNEGNKFIVGVMRDMTEHHLVKERIKNQSDALETALKASHQSRRIMSSMLDDNNKIREDLEKRLKELQRSQNMLIHSEKLASLGRLVSEITHEINNPLMIISGNAQLALMSTPIDDEVKKSLEIIVEECQRTKNVTKRILRFSKPSKNDVKEVDIGQSIEAVVSIIERQFNLNNVRIKRQYFEKPIRILLDEQQMHEVFMNLLNNANEAMPKGGVVTISTSIEGMYLKIDFKDEGVGMSEEVMRKITEPFFTTKETGTGIGLGICYSIIKAYNGELTYTSELGKGTVVTVWLPLKGEGKNNGKAFGSR